MLLTVSARALGKRKPLVPDWQLPLPPEGQQGGEPITLRALITRVVVNEVDAFKKRQHDRKVVRILTERQMEEGLAKGKVDSGGRDLHQDVDAETAVANALLAFEDGLYLVILDGEEQRELDREVFIHAESHLVFVRLVMLAGG